MFAAITSLLFTLLISGGPAQDKPAMRQESPYKVRHNILAFGAETFQISTDSKVVWTYPQNTRDGWLLPNDNLLLVITKSDERPNGAVVQVDRTGKIVFEVKGTQSEINSAQPLPDSHIVFTEAGPKPRLMELDKFGKVVVEFPLLCQTQDFHMQTRMARKLSNGNYLVPHLLDLAVREYAPDGKVVWEVKTPNWPFAAIRLSNGNTLITCTRGNMVIEVDREGKTVWQVTNDDLPGAPLKDTCGAQRLENGNTVIGCYGAGDPNAIKMLEVTKLKRIVWTLYTGKPHGIHEFQILNSNGSLPTRRPLR